MTDRSARRQFILGAAALLAAPSFARASPAYVEHATEADKARTFSRTFLHQEVDFAVPPHRIYDALLDEKQFAAFTTMPARISRDVGGKLWMFNGIILGRNVELVPDKRIVQAWREFNWAPGVYSVVKFELTPHGAGTHLVLDHTGFRQGDFWHLNPGWTIRYWNPMKKYLK